MECHVCAIISPHLLEALAAGEEDPGIKQMALNTLAHTSHILARRKDDSARMNTAEAARDRTTTTNTVPYERGVIPQGIVPVELHEHAISPENPDAESGEMAQNTLEINQQLRDVTLPYPTPITAGGSASIQRQIYDMQNVEQKVGIDDQTYNALPGKLVRSEGVAPIADNHANQAYDNCGIVHEFYRQVFDYQFLDNTLTPIISSIHFEKGYQNALWIGDSTMQMIYGDGGGKLYNFTACLDIVGHEMTHAITQAKCGLQYQGESGALNEHISDVFGMSIRLWNEKKTSAESDWLIGENCLCPGIKGVAIRNMKFPGTAYNDTTYGKDLQPASLSEMEAFKKVHVGWATFDQGCVHIFSGIPNRAFVLAAEAFGGYCWDTATKIWWVTVTTNQIPPMCTFEQFATATTEVANTLLGQSAREVVRAAWNEVGIQVA